MFISANHKQFSKIQITFERVSASLNEAIARSETIVSCVRDFFLGMDLYDNFECCFLQFYLGIKCQTMGTSKSLYESTGGSLLTSFWAYQYDAFT